MAAGDSSPPPSPLSSPSPARRNGEEEDGEGKGEGRERDFRHICSLCMEPYQGRTPKLLPCFHTFCLPCLAALEESALTSASRHQPRRDAEADTEATKDAGTPEATAEGEERGEEAGSGPSHPPDGSGRDNDVTGDGDDVRLAWKDVGRVTFPCPTCRAPVVVPEGGVNSLQTNFYIDHDDYSACHDEPATLCDMCEGENRKDATHSCRECHLKMCRQCRRCHDMVARDHHVTPLSLGAPVKEKGREVKGREMKSYCLVHQDQPLCFLCRRCDVSLCLHCKLTSHDGHDTVDLVSAILDAKKEIASLIPDAQQQLQVMNSSLDQMDRESHQLVRHTQEMTQEVHTRYDSLVTWASKSRDQLVADLTAAETLTRGQLHAEKATVTLTRDALSALLPRAARATSTDPEVVMVRKDLKAALLDDDGLKQLQGRAAPKERAWDWRYDVTDAAVLHPDDVSAYMGRVVSEGAADAYVDKEPVLLRELADRVDRWMKDTSAVTDSLTSKLTTCQDEIKQFKGDVSQCRNDITQLRKDLDNGVGSLQKTTQSIQGSMVQAERCFHATGLDQDKTKRGQAAIFCNVPVNKGDDFDAQTGVFTVPKAGVYMFGATIETLSEDSYAAMHIMVEDQSGVRVKGSYNGSSGSVFASLGAGSRVWLKAVEDGYKYYPPCTSFSGAYIQATAIS